MRTVVTVHGVNTKGQWQEDLQPLFTPHFHYVIIKYPSYRWFGVFKLVLEPWVLFPLGAALLWMMYRGLIAGWFHLTIWFLAVLILAHLSSYVRRWLTLAFVKRRVTRHMLFGRRPHVIAHSLGTYLMSRTLKKFSDVRAHNLILAGSVISRSWDWTGLLARNQFAFRRIRNEVAMKDWVARLAYFLEGLIPGFGMAGFAGFYEVPDVIHTVASSNSSCGKCPATPAVIHNVKSLEAGHSDAFIGPGYAASFWLPYLWDIDPPEYQRFMEMCVLAYDLQEMGDNVGIRPVERELRDTPWSWIAPQSSLAKYVEEQVLAHPSLTTGVTITDVVSLGIAGMWRAAALASDAVQHQEPGWEGRVRALHPKVAIAIAVDGALH